MATAVKQQSEDELNQYFTTNTVESSLSRDIKAAKIFLDTTNLRGIKQHVLKWVIGKEGKL